MFPALLALVVAAPIFASGHSASCSSNIFEVTKAVDVIHMLSKYDEQFTASHFAEIMKGSPGPHPSGRVCSSYFDTNNNDKSCCGPKVLDMVDKWAALVSEEDQTLERSGGYELVDLLFQLIPALDATLKEIDIYIDREKVASEAYGPLVNILSANWDTLKVPILTTVETFISYVQGLICSACVFDSHSFLDVENRELTITEKTCSKLSDSVSEALTALGNVLTNKKYKHEIKKVISGLCNGIGMNDCNDDVISEILKMFYEYVSAANIKRAVCGEAGKDDCKDAVCKDFVHGLNFETDGLKNNLADYSKYVCEDLKKSSSAYPKEISSAIQRLDCSKLSSSLHRSGDVFSSVRNIYTDTGFPAWSVGCENSELSTIECDSLNGDSGFDSGFKWWYVGVPVMVIAVVASAILVVRHRRKSDGASLNNNKLLSFKNSELPEFYDVDPSGHKLDAQENAL